MKVTMELDAGKYPKLTISAETGIESVALEYWWSEREKKEHKSCLRIITEIEEPKNET